MQLRFLDKFREELEEAAMYIEVKLQNPEAADKLVSDVQKAIRKRLDQAEAFEKYHSYKERRYPYYRIYVGNYVVYYVVIDDEGDDKIMEVRRFLYAGRDRHNIV